MILNPFSWGARSGAAPTSDHRVGLMVFFLLALVFAPIIGLHIALATSQAADAPASSEADVAHVRSSKGTRG